MRRIALGMVGALALLWVVPGLGAAQESGAKQFTIDFEGFFRGEVVSAVPHPGGDGVIRIHGVNPGFVQNAAVVFDSSSPGRDDPDLGTPHEDFEIEGEDPEPKRGPGKGEGGRKGNPCQNHRPLGMILIVDDDLSPATGDGRVLEPDDEGRTGARLQLDFSEVGPVTIHGMAVLDIEEPDAEISFYRVGMEERKRRPRSRQVLARYRVHTEDNGVARLFDPELRDVPESGCHVTLVARRHGEPLQPVTGVMSIETVFSGSGAIAGIIYSVPPAGERGRKGR